MADAFRAEHRELSADERHRLLALKQKARELQDLLDGNAEISPNGRRELALAKTNLEQAVMWAVKGITAPPAAVNNTREPQG